MVNLTIDGQKVTAPKGATIMQAADSIGIRIPRLCYLEGINEISACKVCVVEVQGKTKLVTACSTPVQEGIVVYTNSPKVRAVRRTNVELILSQHDCLCATCVRSGNCALQSLANDLGIFELPYEKDVVDIPWDKDFPLIRDSKKCIKCMRCIQICDKVQGLNIWDLVNTGGRTTVDVSDKFPNIAQSDCSLCGQCITHCPVGALKERDDVPKIFEVLANPDKVTEKIEHLLAEMKALASENEALKSKAAKDALGDVMNQVREIAGVKVLAAKVADVDMNGLRDLGDQLKEKIGEGIVVIASNVDGKVNLMATATDIAINKGAHAGNLIKGIAALVGGGGGEDITIACGDGHGHGAVSVLLQADGHGGLFNGQQGVEVLHAHPGEQLARRLVGVVIIGEGHQDHENDRQDGESPHTRHAS